jgi:hypothetical protein
MNLTKILEESDKENLNSQRSHNSFIPVRKRIEKRSLFRRYRCIKGKGNTVLAIRKLT